MAEIKLVNVTKKFGKEEGALKEVNLNIEDGEFVVLLGATGSGKTAILRLIAGLDDIEKDDQGEIYIGERKVNGMLPKDRNASMIFRNHQLMPHLTVYENMAFGLKLRKFSADEIDARIKEVARILGLTDFLSRKPKLLSSLERQRLSIARSLVREPDVYLFDDPLSGLDDSLLKQVRAELIKLQYRFKGTFIYATRDQIDAMTMATKIVVLNNGVVEQIGSPKELYQNPQTVYVATYIGAPQINIAPASLKKDDSGVFVEAFDGNKIYLASQIIEKISELDAYLSGEKQLTIAVRPESIATGEGEIKAIVDAIENYGAYKVATLKMPGKTIGEWSAFISSESEIAVGQEVCVSISGENIHLFDRETEINICK